MAAQIKLRTDFVQIFRAPRQRPLPNRHHAVHLALALPDEDRAALCVNIVPPQIDHLHPPHPRAVKHLVDGPVPHPHRLRGVNAVQDRLNLGLAQDSLGKPLIQPRQLQIRGRIAQQVVVLHQPAKQRPDRDDPAMLGAHRQRLTVPLAVMEQMPLIGLQYRLGDLLGIFQAPLIGPSNEVAQIGLAVANRARAVMPLQLIRQEPPHPVVKRIPVAWVPYRRTRRLLAFLTHEVLPLK